MKRNHVKMRAEAAVRKWLAVARYEHIAADGNDGGKVFQLELHQVNTDVDGWSVAIRAKEQEVDFRFFCPEKVLPTNASAAMELAARINLFSGYDKLAVDLEAGNICLSRHIGICGAGSWSEVKEAIEDAFFGGIGAIYTYSEALLDVLSGTLTPKQAAAKIQEESDDLS